MDAIVIDGGVVYLGQCRGWTRRRSSKHRHLLQAVGHRFWPSQSARRHQRCWASPQESTGDGRRGRCGCKGEGTLDEVVALSQHFATATEELGGTTWLMSLDGVEAWWDYSGCSMQGRFNESLDLGWVEIHLIYTNFVYLCTPIF